MSWGRYVGLSPINLTILKHLFRNIEVGTVFFSSYSIALQMMNIPSIMMSVFFVKKVILYLSNVLFTQVIVHMILLA